MSVKAPENVLKGDIASIVVTVKADGVPGVDVPVTLERPGGKTLRQVILGPADGTRPVVTFRLPMEELGPCDLAVTVGPLHGDARPDNDRRALTIQVADDKARVLVVDGEARWEFRYLFNALKRDPRIAVEAVIFGQPRFSASIDTYKDALPPPPRAGATDSLGAYDTIIVGDIEPDQMAEEAWSRLESFVAHRGGTLILSSGPRAWPGAICRGSGSQTPARARTDSRHDRFAAVDPAHPSLAPARSSCPPRRRPSRGRCYSSLPAPT